MSLSAKIAHNTLIQIIGKIASTILGLFALALITRYLGQTGFGEYTTIITFLTFFAVMADFGLTLVTVQMISDTTGNEQKLLNNLFSLRLVSVVLFLCLAPIIVFFLPYSSAVKLGVLIAAISFIFPALNQVIIGLFQKRLSMDRSALAEVVGRLILVLGILLAKNGHSGLNGVLFATIASSAINFLINYFCSLKFTRLRLEFDWSVWKKIFSLSWPLAITIVLNLIYLRADTLILSFFRGPEEVGLYGASYKIIDVLTTLPFMFGGLMLPILTASWIKGDHIYFKKVLQKSFDVMAVFALPLVAGAQFLGNPIMTRVAGKDFAASGPILQILIFAVAAIFLGTMFSHAVIALNKQKKMIRFYIFTSLSALIAYLVLIPKFSYFGAASVTIYSEVMIAVFSAYCVFKYSHFLPKLKTTLIAAAATIIMSIFLYLSPSVYNTSLSGLILVLSLASLIYFLAFCLMSGLKIKDLLIIFKRQEKSGGQTYGSTNNF